MSKQNDKELEREKKAEKKLRKAVEKLIKVKHHQIFDFATHIHIKNRKYFIHIWRA